MDKHTLYIGSDNTTGELDLDGIKAVVNLFFNNYTLIPNAQGYFERVKENTAIVIIYTSQNQNVRKLARALAYYLGQECVMLDITTPERLEFATPDYDAFENALSVVDGRRADRIIDGKFAVSCRNNLCSREFGHPGECF